ncbi:DUF4136 domain-containing protein [Mucilaginibacter sp. Bleaf8]|uniref:DUF4136 domain-containing protein n=1 Tax=Mucilaginibacter sp. Bleaf8 TaxID=2834430 RepID=UPI001BD14B62|nr:DUF4136 domain-containing protein [Mucilaginibacter sp. Bleaf8]MBS7564305.1 DUF4136 domain-containing protein [Mucilaginibacter sp. Bleaf8]
MKKISFVVILFLLGSLFAACSRYTYYAVGSNNTNLSRYHTFAWLPAVKNASSSAYNSDITDQRIKEAVTENLEQRGLMLKAKKPDLLVRYSIMVSDKERVYDQPVYDYAGGGVYPAVGMYRGRRFYYYRYSNPYPVYVGDDVERVPYKEGTLMIDLVDRQSHKVIWRGYGVGEVDNPAKAIQDIPKIVSGIIKKLPLTPQNQR